MFTQIFFTLWFCLILVLFIAPWLDEQIRARHDGRAALPRGPIQPSPRLRASAREVLPLRKVCAWCGLVMHSGAPGAATSHGCCPS